MAPRRPTTAQVRVILEPAVVALGAWLDDLLDGATGTPDALLDVPSVLPGWSLRDLVAHVVAVSDSVVHLAPLPRSAPVLSVAEYVGGYPAGAHVATERARALAADETDLAAAFRRRWSAAWQRLDELGATPTVQSRRGALPLADFLATRVLEVVVHSDDLARSAHGHGEPAVPAEAERLVVRLLLDALAQRHPGQAVEVRVPPVAAVQCLPGPRHTRGTPPGVVETGPRTWVRLATGRLSWADAVHIGAVTASGERSDLGDVLPLL